MSYNRIVCTEQTGCRHSGHIVAVGVGDDPSSASSRETVLDVWAALDRGDVYYTVGSGGEVALVNKYTCGCGVRSLRSSADATVSNNLDYMRLCAWSAA